MLFFIQMQNMPLSQEIDRSWCSKCKNKLHHILNPELENAVKYRKHYSNKLKSDIECLQFY